MSSKELQQSLMWEASERFSVPRESIQVDGVMTGARAPGVDDDRAEVVLFALDALLLQQICVVGQEWLRRRLWVVASTLTNPGHFKLL